MTKQQIKEMVAKGIEERDKLVQDEIEYKRSMASKKPKIINIRRNDVYKRRINNVKHGTFNNYQMLKEMEMKEKEILNRLKDTFDTVAREQDKVKSLQGYGKKRANIKHAQSVIADYINSPVGANTTKAKINESFNLRIKQFEGINKNSANSEKNESSKNIDMHRDQPQGDQS